MELFTIRAVGDLLRSAGLNDSVGWLTRNAARALLMASREISSWEGDEWALASDGDERALAWAGPDADRVPFAWLRARTGSGDGLFAGYQDDVEFGLRVAPPDESENFQLMREPELSMRPSRDLPFAMGPVREASVVFDTTHSGGSAPAVMSEVLIETTSSSTLLIAAELYEPNTWRLYNEMVVALPSLAVADRLEWSPPRLSWS